ncbi:ankyrin repeat and LEM domain-containing protein 2 [Trichomycterus rosablanca]|uniref:ankyrin repeat and LEM domain-containing protein 2 n=1 Tax=Trichomycterus rosablanca TaxID=2290929 RepID=UPI002F350EB6
MEAVLSRLQTLTPDELREEILRAGLNCGPITASTRSVFEKKLARTLVGDQTGGCSRSEVDSGSTDGAPADNSEVIKSDKENASPSVQNSEDTSQLALPDSPSVFYGVFSPLDHPSCNDGSLHVYADQQKAVKAAMKMKGARFKAFLSRDEAENFAKRLHDGSVSPNKPSADELHTSSPDKSANLETANMEKPNEFNSIRTQDLTAKLRKAVENGDEEAFKELVWSNPRYLIGSGDNPTIVQEGCRYNVLHIAAKENQAGMAALILETLQSLEFMRLMYPDDQEDILLSRMSYIVDLYLNTPDKLNNETPLHFACKFGCPEVVDVLCSHPAIDKNRTNKYGQIPSTMICDRKNKNKNTKDKIQEYLEDRFFVPLLRATDNTLNPVIGLPWAPGSSKCANLLLSPGSAEDPKNPLMTIRAFVGPLNSLKAKEFYKLWKTPPRSRAKYFHHILKSDPDRGAERVGRELTHEMGYHWAEYWDFLNCFTDLSLEDGLNMLEEYLNEVIQQKNAAGKSWPHLESAASIAAHKNRTRSGTFLDDCLHSPSEVQSEVRSKENGSQFIVSQSPVCDLMNEFERVSFTPAENMADSGLGGMALSGSEGGAGFDGRAWECTQNEKDESSSDEFYTADEDSNDPWQVDGRRERCNTPRGCGLRGRTSSVSSCSSYKSTHSAPEDTEEICTDVFLAGDSPSKLDSEVLLAVSGIDIDQQRYPSITKWRDTVLSYPESQRNRWPNITVRNRHAENQTSTPRRLTHSWLTGSPSFLNLKRFFPA